MNIWGYLGGKRHIVCATSRKTYEVTLRNLQK